MVRHQVEKWASVRSGASFEYSIYLLMLLYRASTHPKENP